MFTKQTMSDVPFEVWSSEIALGTVTETETADHWKARTNKVTHVRFV